MTIEQSHSDLSPQAEQSKTIKIFREFSGKPIEVPNEPNKSSQ